ncbi:MAG: hypothetical protein COV99_06540 [Bacteroidetes bacterium CG12_big_fil_rev_8_21_14_0_65_60_17]|nr:MAG: hypothetical protein COV99_06540 [Bacteroidetes bacterium CG12_big_fil_rev_8_21_14_0_65_60_17]
MELVGRSFIEYVYDAVVRVDNGRRYISPALAEKLQDVLEDFGDNPLHAALSDREFEVMRGIVDGHSLTHIGVVMNVSVKTVSMYRSRILEKLYLDSNAELVKYAMQHNLFGPEQDISYSENGKLRQPYPTTPIEPRACCAITWGQLVQLSHMYPCV